MPAVKSIDHLVLTMLAHRVRLLSALQVGTLLRPAGTPEQQLRAGIDWGKRFARAGVVECYRITAREPVFDGPVATFQEGDAVPNFQAVSRALLERAKAGTPEATLVMRLGEHGAKAFSVRQPRIARRCEETHELRLAEVALHFEKEGARTWRSEDELQRTKVFHGVVPDALLTLANGEVVIVECGGSYSAARLEHFHQAVVPQMRAVGASRYVIV